jgi:hypothetical protein
VQLHTWHCVDIKVLVFLLLDAKVSQKNTLSNLAKHLHTPSPTEVAMKFSVNFSNLATFLFFVSSVSALAGDPCRLFFPHVSDPN